MLRPVGASEEAFKTLSIFNRRSRGEEQCPLTERVRTITMRSALPLIQVQKTRLENGPLAAILVALIRCCRYSGAAFPRCSAVRKQVETLAKHPLHSCMKNIATIQRVYRNQVKNDQN